MSVIHFLNVKRGDCSIIRHNSGRVSVIDVCNAKQVTPGSRMVDSFMIQAAKDAGLIAKASGRGNFNQKKYPVNPIIYMKKVGIQNVWRFILTHPDMDHMDGIKALWDAFQPSNFWDTNNNCEKEEEFKKGGQYNENDWNFYKVLRTGQGT